MDTREWDAVIIGGAVAGLSAAQMLGRARRKTLVIDSGSPRNRFATHMHGVLGHDGVDPAELLERGRAEAAAYGVAIEHGEVVDVRDDDEGRMLVARADGTIDRTRAVVVTTGIRDELPAVRGMAELWGRSVLHCPYCHGWEVADQRLGVLATSPASIHQIELVRQWSDDVTAFTALAEPLAPEVSARLVARGIRVVRAPLTALESEGGRLVAATDAGGTAHPLDALFVAPSPTVRLEPFASLGLARTDAPGGPLAVDGTGATNHPRVWAAGNVTAPFGNVPLSMGAGSMAGAAVNAALVAGDAAAAVEARGQERNAHWEEHYATGDRVWSGKVNSTLADVVASLPPGRALDVGCGEGGDALWLAARGWQVTGIDVSATAIARARDAARAAGLTDAQASFEVGDAAEAPVGDRFDLVTASFLHSWEPDFPRVGLLRAAAGHVAPGGRLVILSHAAPPPWRRDDESHTTPHLHRPEDEVALLGFDPDEWMLEVVEVRQRAVTAPDGGAATLDDGVIEYRRKR